MSFHFKGTDGLVLFSGLKKNVPHVRWIPLRTLFGKITVFEFEYHYFFYTVWSKELC